MKNPLIAVLLVSMGAAPSLAAETTKLVYALPTSLPASVAYITLDKGFFKEEGLEVEAKMFSSGREALQALLAGQAQIQTVSETPVVHAILQGNKIVTVATICRHQEAKLIARKDRGINKPGDIRGKKLATLPGTNSDYFMYRFLEAHALRIQDVKIANMNPPEMVVAYAKGDIDGYFAWEPHITYGRRQLPEQSLVFYPGNLYRGWSMVNMDPEFVEKNPDAVRRILRALMKGEDFIRRHPEESMALVAKRLKMEEPVLRELWKEQTFKVELDRTLPELMRRIGAWAVREKGLGEQLPDFRSHIYDKALAAERRSAVKL